ncbi:MAG TPA: hypothetical protein ENN49_09435 [Bacteroidales bacterium]|nr:hypothetical protein [Bacteroidales bacterium]
MKKLLFITAFSVLTAFISVAQEQPQKPKIEVKPYGYVAWETIFDTYKSVDTRDGELYFYPLKANIDANGTDVNRKHQLQMLSLTTRLGLKISGPDVLGAKTSGMVETDFFATANEYTRLLRIRHAIVTLKWQQSELIMGHYWHPIIVNEVIPATIAFGAGVPFHSLNRSPQIRFTYYPIENVRVSATALTQGYHKSMGPADAQRNSGLPEVLTQAAFVKHNSFIAGISAGYKWLTPRLYIASSNTGTHKTIGQYLFSAFAAANLAKTNIKLETVYGENPTHLLMIGGYGRVTETSADTDYDYANLLTHSTWFDVDHKMGKWAIGFFGGYSKLNGSSNNYSTIANYNRNDDMNYIYRISPRVSYKEKNLMLGIEYMLTTAVYGKTFDAQHKVTSSLDPVSNHRITLCAKYTF